MRTRFTTEDTENAQRNTDLNAKRSENRSREHFLILKISFAFFCIFREIRGRAHFLPFSSFFSVLSMVSSEPGSVRTFRKRHKKRTPKSLSESWISQFKTLITTRSGRTLCWLRPCGGRLHAFCKRRLLYCRRRPAHQPVSSRSADPSCCGQHSGPSG